MPLVQTLEVIWTYDGLIQPPGPKMVVCLCPELGWFARINTEGWRRGSVLIPLASHRFLKHDSHLECGALFDLDDYLLQQALDQRGILGRVDKQLASAISAEVAKCQTLRENDLVAIRKALAAA